MYTCLSVCFCAQMISGTRLVASLPLYSSAVVVPGPVATYSGVQTMKSPLAPALPVISIAQQPSGYLSPTIFRRMSDVAGKMQMVMVPSQSQITGSSLPGMESGLEVLPPQDRTRLNSDATHVAQGRKYTGSPLSSPVVLVQSDGAIRQGFQVSLLL